MKKIFIDCDITKNTVLNCNTIYIIKTQINVFSCVEVENNCIILLLSNHGSLIFQNGSSLKGKNIKIYSCNSNNEIITEDTRPSIENNKIEFYGHDTCIKATFISLNFIGSVKLNSISKNNFEVEKFASLFTGKDGIKIINSEIHFKKVYVKNPRKNGICLDNSTIDIKKTIKVNVESLYVNGSGYGLFNFLNNNTDQYIRINTGSKVYLNGSRFYPIINYEYTKLTVISEDLPEPINNIQYFYEGILNSKINIITLNNHNDFKGSTGVVLYFNGNGGAGKGSSYSGGLSFFISS